MMVVAPGKLLITGAYAVLRGAPAVVMAVDRYARAQVGAPVDTTALYSGRTKMGLGSSAAFLVAKIGLEMAAEGQDLTNDRVRADIFSRAWAEHTAKESGGSGVDIAASTYGGVLIYTMPGHVVRTALPTRISFEAFWTGRSAKTRDLRANVDGLRQRDPRLYDACVANLRAASTQAAGALHAEDAHTFVRAARETAYALRHLGEAANAPIFPDDVVELADLAETEDAALYPSGAGGGDIVIYVGPKPPSDALRRAIERAAFSRVDLRVDDGGVRALPTDSASRTTSAVQPLIS